MATPTQLALFANAAYRDIRDPANAPVIPEDWTRLIRTDFGLSSAPGSGGFSAEIFQKGSEIVIAFQGTNSDPFTADGLKDWGTNAGLAFVGIATSQLKQAATLYKRVQQVFPGANITFTGHSLGGGLAGLMSIQNEWGQTPLKEQQLQ